MRLCADGDVAQGLLWLARGLQLTASLRPEDRDDLDLYGEMVEVSFEARIRGMKLFASVDDLVATIGEDVERARLLLDVPEPP